MSPSTGSGRAPSTGSGGALPESPDPLPGPVVDTHCHLDVAAEITGLDAGGRTRSGGRRSGSAVSCRSVAMCRVRAGRYEAAARWPAVVAGVAMHPNDAARIESRRAGRCAARDRRTGRRPGRPRRGGDRTGLLPHAASRPGTTVNGSPSPPTSRWRRATTRCLVIHDRDAHAEILAVLDAEIRRNGSSCTASPATPPSRGSAWTAAPSSPSPAPSPSKPTSTCGRRSPLAPLDRILVETDAPFLTPMPYRGRPNASYLIPHTARLMAEVVGIELPGCAGPWTTTPTPRSVDAWGG